MSLLKVLLFALFQLKFAVITPALITGAFAERVKFTSYMLFITLFMLFIYAPLAHMTWHPQGLLKGLGVLDFAGGTVVHMSAGFAALAGAMVLGKRKLDSDAHQPANIPFILLGTGMLWFGWFGFNAGSAVAANEQASLALATTNTASAAAALSW
ncbi:MAG: ammonium transporter, partial [Cytophagaceae bacterium]